MKTCLVGTVIGVFLALAAVARAADDEQTSSFWMKKKLSYSEQILAGLTSGNLEQVAKQARTMSSLGQLEKWVRANSSDYRAQLRIFQTANKQLVSMADEENLDGAALAYVQLTLSCVNCHKIVRDEPRTQPSRSP